MTGRGGVFGTIAVLLAAAVLFAVGPVSSAMARGGAPKCTIHGTAGPDVLRGTKGTDVICGGGGADTLYGRSGDDSIFGGAGNDKLYGGPGSDFEDGGTGGDVCHGQIGDSEAVDCAVVGATPRVTELDPGPPTTPTAPAPTSPTSIPPPFGPTCEEIACTPPSIPQPPADEAAPELFILGRGPEFIDTSEGPGTVTYYLTTWDESSLKSGSMLIEGPEGAWRTIDFPASEDHLGEYQLPVTVPASTPSGRYRLASITLEDSAGNSTTLGRNRLEADEAGTPTGFDLDFDVYAGPDTTPPVLKGFSLSTDTVDTSAAPASVDFTVEATDDLSGLAAASPSFRLPAAGPQGNTWALGAGSRLAAGTIFDGTWGGQVDLPEDARRGVYAVEGLELRDRAGNSVTYERSELEAMGLPLQFTQEGAGDSVGPQILDFKIDPRTISTANGERSFKVRMHVKDDLSGFGGWPDKSFSDLAFSFDVPGDPQQFETSGRGAELVSGTDLDGVWVLERELPSNAPLGEYPVISVSAIDRAGNQTLIKGPELAAEPWDLSFENLP